MSNSFKTPQEEFWAGEFGTEYIGRNSYENLVSTNIYEWSKIIGKTVNVKSCIEFGANIGANLKALQCLLPNMEISAVEINKTACGYLSKFLKPENIYNKSILEYIPEKTYDLAFIKGVLIHINPNEVQAVYERLYKSSNKYIVIAEYYNPSPVAIDYRGNSDRLFKRDFAGEFLDKYPDTKLVDYGFYYHRDNNFSLDDITWFLIEKV